MVDRETDQAQPSGDAVMTLAPGEDSTTEVRAGFGFDEAALGRWMREHVAGFEGPFSVRQFQGGQSNPTFRVTTGAASYVLRRKPPRSEEHTYELQSLMRTSYAVFCFKKKTNNHTTH